MVEEQKILGFRKIIIIADFREKEITKKLQSYKDVKVITMNLPVADYICSNEIGVERKTYEDFVSSIIDGRIFDQAQRLSESFTVPVIVIEGFSEDISLNENAIIAAKATLISRYKISVIYSRNPEETAKLIYFLAKKSQRENKFIGIKLNKKAETISQQQEKIIASLPGISTVLSRRLLRRFGSVENVILASENELSKVKGIGKKLAKRIKKVLSEKYHSENT